MTTTTSPAAIRVLALTRAGATEAALRRLARSADEASPLPAAGLDEARARAGELEARGVRLLCLCDDAYPAPLRDLPDPPPLLFIQGALPARWDAVGVVGTRQLDDYGRRASVWVARTAVEAGRLVVSGGALGADTVAHQEALAAGGVTVAVLGSGLSELAPPSNRALFERIARDGGALISEFLPEQTPARWTYPKRNRLVAALSDPLVVTRAPMKSGALITARLALGLGRAVWATQGELFDELGAGCSALLDEGARALSSRRAFCDALGHPRAGQERPPADAWMDALSPDARRVARRLAQSAADQDELIQATGLDARRLGVALAELEIDGRIHRQGARIHMR
jgi:DNA processing protein